MSYSELLKELSLDGKVMAITRVKKEDYRINNLGGCIYKAYKRVLGGETLVVAEGASSCKGFDHNSGLNDDMPFIPGGFGIFLAQGSDHPWTPPGEKFKCCPETAVTMWQSMPKDVMDGFDAIKLEPYAEGIECDVVTVFCNAEQLSGMIALYGYSRTDYAPVISTNLSGCASMMRIPFYEMKQEEPKAVITGNDIAARHAMNEDELAISIPAGEFEKILDITGECFFHSPVFKKSKERLQKEAGTEVKFSTIA